MTDDYEVVRDIVSCPRCGTRNRIGVYSKSLRPICAKCKASLEPVLQVSDHTSKKTLPSLIKKSKKNIIYIFISLIVVVGAFFIAHLSFQQKERSQPLSLNNKQVPLNNKQNIDERIHEPKIDRRLSNGTIIRGSVLNGRGQLTVKNGLLTDASAKLINKSSNSCYVYFYISAGSSYTLSGINDGHYRLIFSSGRDWDYVIQNFTVNKAFSEFNNAMIFETTEQVKGRDIYEHYTVMEITLHPVIGGNVKTYNISEDEFNRY